MESTKRERQKAEEEPETKKAKFFAVSDYNDRTPTNERVVLNKADCDLGNVGKQAWPELLGAQVSVAVATIYRENSNVRPIVVPEGSSVTEDIRCDRVRVWVEGRIVSRVPIVG